MAKSKHEMSDANNNDNRIPRVPNDPYTPYEKPEGDIGLIFLKHSFHKYSHPFHHNEFGLPTFPLHPQELECARRDTMDHFLQWNRSLLCQEIFRSLADEVDGSINRLNIQGEELKQKLERHLQLQPLDHDARGSSQKMTEKDDEMKQWIETCHRLQDEIQGVMNEMKRVKRIHDDVIVNGSSDDNKNDEWSQSHSNKEQFKMATLDEHVKQSMIQLGLHDQKLVQDRSYESLTDSMNQQLVKCQMGVSLPESITNPDALVSVDTELLKYYNCLHASFANVLMAQTVGKCRGELAEFRVCHTRLFKMPNIKDNRWNKYVQCVRSQNEWFYRHMTDQLRFYERPNWFAKLWRGKEL